MWESVERLMGLIQAAGTLSRMLKGKKELVANASKAPKAGKDSDIKSFAAATLPTLQDLLKMAQDIFSFL
jgi:hypothetical protein